MLSHRWNLIYLEVLMELRLGDKIRELRKRDGRTQENLADALGVTCQAVSRWEQNSTFPDMTLIPSIANYFGVSIDQLFGYENDRDRRIAAIIEETRYLSREDNGVDINIDKRLSLLRNALIEFPANETLLCELGYTLVDTGYIRIGQSSVIECEHYTEDKERHNSNPYWNEAIPIFEKLIGETQDSRIREKSSRWLIDLYCNMGNHDRAMAIAVNLPEMAYCREFSMARAAKGAEEEMLRGKTIILLARELSFAMVSALQTRPDHFHGDLPVKKIQAMIDLYHAVYSDGNMGCGHGMLIQLYLYMSEFQWKCGLCDEAFASLDTALEHAKKLEEIAKNGGCRYTDPLLTEVIYETEPNENPEIAKLLPDDWPFWFVPNCSEVKAEITADPRWNEWVEKCRS